MSAARVRIVDACTRDGGGGRPTAVVVDHPWLSATQRRAIARHVGPSHTAFVTTHGRELVDVQFLTPEQELMGCGHGTIAVHAALAIGTDAPPVCRQRTGGRTLLVDRRHVGAEVEVWFDQAPVKLTEPPADIVKAALDALDITSNDLDENHAPALASPGSPRLLLGLRPAALAALAPDFTRLGAATADNGLLGCFAYAAKEAPDRFLARMFAPAIGVEEDIANANSSSCLAALVASKTHQSATIRVDQGDRFGAPSTIYASAQLDTGDLAVRIGARARPRSMRTIDVT